MTQLEQIIQKLPPELQAEVTDFADFLLKTKVENGVAFPRQTRLKMTWANGLNEYKDQYTSISLQKQSLAWWN